MEILLLCAFGAAAMALISIVVGAFFSGERIMEERFERRLSDEESQQNKRILEANINALSLSDDDLAVRLSKHNKGVKLTVHPGGRGLKP